MSGRDRDRRGWFLTPVVLCLGFVALLSGTIQSLRGRVIMGRADRIHMELAGRDLVVSALEEATHELMSAVNTPSHPLHASLREPGDEPIQFTPSLERTRCLAHCTPHAAVLESQILVMDRTALVEGGEDQEWIGRVVVTVRVQLTRPVALALEGREEREIKVTLITPPRPLGRYTLIDPRISPREWRPPLPDETLGGGLALAAEIWEAKATLRLGSKARQDIEVLRERLGVINGVVLVDNRQGPALGLADLTWRGKTVLVVRGDVELRDVRLEQEGTDLLTIIAFGDVTVSGQVEACLILTRSAEDQSPRRTVRRGSRIRGSLLVTEGTCDREDDLEIEDMTRWTDTGPAGTPLPLDRLYVSVSPQLDQHWIGVMP